MEEEEGSRRREELGLNPLTYLERGREEGGLMNNTPSEKQSIFVLPQQRLHTQHQLLFKSGDSVDGML